MRVSVIIPSFNERASLPELLAELNAVAAAANVEEVVVVDDGSTDGTFEYLREAVGRYPWLKGLRLRGNRGKAPALAAGFAAATGDTMVTLDGDLQDDPAELPTLLAALSTVDLVVGWKTPRLDPWTKVLPSRIFNGLVRHFTGIRVHDVNSGAKAMRAEVAREMQLYGELHRFVPALAAFAGYRVGEVSVRHRPRRYGQSKYGWRRFARGLFDLATVTFLHRYGLRPLHWFGGIGAMSALLGFGIGVYLAVLHFAGQSIGDRPLLLLAVLLVLAGLQLIFTGFLAELIVRGQGNPPPAVSERLGFAHGTPRRD